MVAHTAAEWEHCDSLYLQQVGAPYPIDRLPSIEIRVGGLTVPDGVRDLDQAQAQSLITQLATKGAVENMFICVHDENNSVALLDPGVQLAEEIFAEELTRRFLDALMLQVSDVLLIHRTVALSFVPSDIVCGDDPGAMFS